MVLEDDVSFESLFGLVLHAVVEDIRRTELPWDLIYLGRKIQEYVADEVLVTGRTEKMNTLAHITRRSSVSHECHLLLLDDRLSVEQYWRAKARARQSTRSDIGARRVFAHYVQSTFEYGVVHMYLWYEFEFVHLRNGQNILRMTRN
jgi:hypothetical protein